jgi:hypothetical protein
MKIVLIVVVAIVLGIAIGYYAGLAHVLQTMVPALDLMRHSYIPYVMEFADSAYQKEPTETAIWALKQSAATLKALLEPGYESRFYPRNHIEMYLMITYAKLALLTEAEDVSLSQEYIDQAFEFCPLHLKSTLQTKEQLFNYISPLDAE